MEEGTQLSILQETPVWSKMVSCSNVPKFYYPEDWKVKDNLEVAMDIGYLNDILGGRFAYPCQFDPYYVIGEQKDEVEFKRFSFDHEEKNEVYLERKEHASLAVVMHDLPSSSIGYALSASEANGETHDHPSTGSQKRLKSLRRVRFPANDTTSV